MLFWCAQFTVVLCCMVGVVLARIEPKFSSVSLDVIWWEKGGTSTSTTGMPHHTTPHLSTSYVYVRVCVLCHIYCMLLNQNDTAVTECCHCEFLSRQWLLDDMAPLILGMMRKNIKREPFFFCPIFSV